MKGKVPVLITTDNTKRGVFMGFIDPKDADKETLDALEVATRALERIANRANEFSPFVYCEGMDICNVADDVWKIASDAIEEITRTVEGGI